MSFEGTPISDITEVTLLNNVIPRQENNEEDIHSQEENEENEENEDDPDTTEVEELQKEAYKKKSRKRTSKVWEDMEELIVDGVKKARCNFCKTVIGVPRSGATTQLSRHLKSCVQKKVKSGGKNQGTLAFSANEVASTLTTFKYDHAKVRELAAHMVLAHEYPFMHMEHVIFNKFMKAASPFYEKISRHTVRNDCFSTYEIEKKKLKILLKDVNKVSITTDLWKASGQNIQYMVVTCHFIDAEWKLQKRVLRFCNIPPPHSGIVVADSLIDCLVEWGLENKLCTVTVDNASYNDAAIGILKDSFALRGNLFFRGKFFHVRCCAHILNILVQHGLKEITHIVYCVREAIKYLSHSEARLAKFSEITKQLNLPTRKLILDCPTRWNGTYLMLASALEFKAVFPRYQQRDPGFNYVPSTEDWVKVDQVCQFLGIFNEVTNIISGSDYPTSNLFLPEMWRIKEILNAKVKDNCGFMKSMALAMSAKYEKYWGECNMLISIAAVLDPRYKMRLVEFCFPEIYSAIEAERNVTLVRDTLYELYEDYRASYTSSEHSMRDQSRERGSSSGSISSQIGSKNVLSGKAKFESFMRQSKNIQPVKSELDMYLEEGLYVSEDGSTKFDAIEWWKLNNLKFRVLSRLACDILAIPITTVASESTFSAGGRVIDQYRASLSVDTVQMLFCASDWVRVLHGIKKKPKDEDRGYTEFAIP